jgi:hypothetical protein
VPSQPPRQVRQSRVLHSSWSWRIYGWLCSQQHWRVLPSGFRSLARRGSSCHFSIEWTVLCTECMQTTSAKTVCTCLFPLLAVTSRYNFLHTLDWYHHS